MYYWFILITGHQADNVYILDSPTRFAIRFFQPLIPFHTFSYTNLKVCIFLSIKDALLDNLLYFFHLFLIFQFCLIGIYLLNHNNLIHISVNKRIRQKIHQFTHDNTYFVKLFFCIFSLFIFCDGMKINNPVSIAFFHSELCCHFSHFFRTQ